MYGLDVCNGHHSWNVMKKGTLKSAVCARPHSSLRFAFLIVDGVSIGQHALMQNARKQNAPALLAVEQHMLTMLQTAQTRANVVTEPA